MAGHEMQSQLSALGPFDRATIWRDAQLKTELKFTGEVRDEPFIKI